MLSTTSPAEVGSTIAARHVIAPIDLLKDNPTLRAGPALHGVLQKVVLFNFFVERSIVKEILARCWPVRRLLARYTPRYPTQAVYCVNTSLLDHYNTLASGIWTPVVSRILFNSSIYLEKLELLEHLCTSMTSNSGQVQV